MAGEARRSIDANATSPQGVSPADLNAMSMYLASKQNQWMAGTHIFRQPPVLPSSDGRIHQRRESTDRHAPSNSTSPHLANTIAPPKDPRPQSSDLLPSPAPSDDFIIEPPRPPPSRSPDNISEASRPATPATATSMDAIRKRAAARGFEHPNKRQASGDMPMSRPQQQFQRPAQAPQQQSTPNFTRPQPVQQSVTQSHPQPQSPAQAQAQAQAIRQNVQRTHSSAGLQFQQQARPQNGTPVLPAPYFDPNYFTIADCEKVFQQVSGQLERFSTGENQRIRVLQDAISRHDFAYLTVHQYYCMATSSDTLLPASVRNLPELSHALQHLGQVLGLNQTLSPPLVQWFANFPKPLAQISLDWPDRYRQEQHAFIRFVQLFGTRYLSFKQLCSNRRWPPLPRELYDVLGIISTTLQKITWRCIRRSIWNEKLPPQMPPIDETPSEKQAEAFFDANQHAYTERFYQMPWLPTGTVGNDQEEDYYGRQLMSGLATHEQFVMSVVRARVQQQGILPPSPTTPQNPSAGHGPGVSANPPARPNVAQHQNIPSTSNTNSATAYIPQARRGPGRPRVDDTVHNLQLHGGAGRGRPPVRPRIDAVTNGSGPGRLPTQLAPSRNIQQPTQQLRPQPPQKPPKRPLFPGSGYQPPQPIDPNPARSALHQAHLRSPVLTVKDYSRSFSNLLYQYVKGFVFAPRILSCDPESPIPPVQTWTFIIDKSAYAVIPKDVLREKYKPNGRIIDETNQSYRLRCVKWNSKEALTEPTWFTADSTWIPATYFKLNGNALEPRKKLHHGKDLPIDLTPYIREGENRLQIFTVRSNAQKAKLGSTLDYALAVEIVGTRSHENIKLRCVQNRKPAQEVLSAIKTSLSGLSEDEELSITSSNISITLFDPISAYKIFDIPVRGRNCLHYDCFDLETYLATRKRKQPTWPSVVDNWRCPICKEDARPSNLIVDGFMEEVRKMLQEQDLLDTRAIIVDPDGSWKPKPEKRDQNGVRDPDTPDEELPQGPSSADWPAPVVFDTRSKPERIVIDLDD